MREVRDIKDVNSALRELYEFFDEFKRISVDLHGKRFTNVGKHVDVTDFVRWDELPTFAAAPAAVKRKGGGNLDKIVFGWGINSSVTVSNDVCPHEPFTEHVSLLNVRALMKNGPTGQDVIFNVLQNGVSSIFTAPVHVPAGGIRSAKITSFAISTFNEDDYLTLNVTQVGSIQAGTDLVVVVRYH